jgi:hypothetical protein
MANYETRFVLTLTDANGNSAKMEAPSGLISDATTMAQLATGINGMITAVGAPGTITNAKVTSAVVTILIEKANATGAVDAQFSGVEDGARLNFLNSSGGRGSSTIPAPIPAVFGAAPNQDVVDPAGAAAAYIAWYTAHVNDQTALLNVYNGGVKVGHHSRKRAQRKVV